jgi:uncharacterized protein DUF3379
MKCSDAHLAIGAEPHGTSAELEEHLRVCAACGEYRREMLALDEHIRRALNGDVPALKSDVPTRSHVRLVSSAPAPRAEASSAAETSWLSSMRRQWALAASALFAVVVGFVLWGALPRHSLASDVVAHVISEPLPSPEKAVPPDALESVLHSAHLHLDPIGQDVLFAQTCFFRGRLVPHFVVRSGDAAVTVLVLPDESLNAPEYFDESGYRGILYPNADHGSIAVLSRGQVNSEQEAREILNALHWQPAA